MTSSAHMRTIIETASSWLARRALASVDPLQAGVAGMKEADRVRLFKDCAQLVGFQSLRKVVEDLKCQQRDITATKATAETIDFARGTLNGISVVMERLEALASYAGGKKPEEFDPYRAI